jgi:phosphopantothenoylcysteine decarboxylase/phosphopantothenate--cysteine ligase
VGFAVESRDLLANARLKLGSKNADLIVANLVSAFGAERSTAHFLTADGPPRVYKDRPKSEIADEIVRFCEEWRAERAAKK